MKHHYTPPPWEPACDRHRQFVWRVIDAEGDVIACVHGASDEEAAANAYLVAAAPHLLECLKNAVDLMEAALPHMVNDSARRRLTAALLPAQAILHAAGPIKLVRLTPKDMP